MTEYTKTGYSALLRRELQEYRNSLLLAPVVVAGSFVLLLLVSVLLTNSLTIVGSSMVEILGDESSSHGINITVSIDKELPVPDYIVEKDDGGEDASGSEWNFGRDWTFNPEPRAKELKEAPGATRPINTVLNGLHWFFLLILLATSINYLLGTLYQDRRDGSILFWKSMPVDEKSEIVAKLITVCVLAPAVYMLASIFAQLCSVLLSMLAVWRMDLSPVEVVLDNIDVPDLLGAQLGGILIWVLWTLPLYAWLLLCSAAAKRSPIMLAVAIPLALVVMEQLFLGSDHLSSAIAAHVRSVASDEANSLGFYFAPPDWRSLDYAGMIAGLLLATLFLYAAARLRQFRLEV